MIEAIYKETGERCYINMDFVVDAFPCEEGVVAYTFDNERGGYVIKMEKFMEYIGADMRGEKE